MLFSWVYQTTVYLPGHCWENKNHQVLERMFDMKSAIHMFKVDIVGVIGNGVCMW